MPLTLIRGLLYTDTLIPPLTDADQFGPKPREQLHVCKVSSQPNIQKVEPTADNSVNADGDDACVETVDNDKDQRAVPVDPDVIELSLRRMTMQPADAPTMATVPAKPIGPTCLLSVPAVRLHHRSLFTYRLM